MSNEIFYTKRITLSLQVTKLKLTDIPIFKSVPLNFYQKYIVLLLKNGIHAESGYDLADKIANILNVSVDCVRDFISILQQENSLYYDEKKDAYRLNDCVASSVRTNNDGLMLIDLSSTTADWEKLVFIDDFDRFFPESAFDNPDLFRKRNSSTSKVSFQRIKDEISNPKTEEEIKKWIKNDFENSSCHLENEPTFSLKDIESSYRIEFDVDVRYKYLQDTGLSLKEKGFSVQKGNNILPDIIEKLLLPFNFDSDIPRYVSLNEPFYQEISSSFEKIQESQKEISILEEKKELSSASSDAGQNTDVIVPKENSKQELPETNAAIVDNKLIVETENQRIEKNINRYGGSLDEKTQEVLEKISKNDSLLYSYIRKICINMDQAISASDCNNLDQVLMNVSSVRDNAQKTLKCIFDVLFKKNKSLEKLASYYEDWKTKISLSNFFVQRGSSIEVLNRLVELRGFENAASHIQEKSGRTKENENTIEQFKKQSPMERKRLLLSYHDFFLNFQMNGKEIELISKQLSFH